MNKNEKLALALEVYEQKLDGVSDQDIRDTLQVGEEEYRVLLRFMHERVAESEARKSSEEVFSEYALEQKRTIRQIDDMVDGLGSKNQYNALIGALRLRKDIVDTILAKGQELGVYELKPKRHEVVGGFIVADLTPGELKEKTKSEMRALKERILQFGDGDIKELPIGDLYGDEQEVVDVPAETISETVIKPKKNASKKRKTSKRRRTR